MKHDDSKMDKKTVKKAVGMHDKQMHGGKKTDLTSLKKGGAMHKMPDGSMMAGKSHGMKKMAAGGMAMVEKDGKKVPAFAADGKGKMACGGTAKKMAKGGGIESKGKTKGRIC